ncbi:hypothetical protein [Ciceribacter sp. L1K22]|uniref:hypothetical protein n=1 Tax=Ciceribacter sp. L1K22 TaxID=2820275 RepID=UPI001ABE93DC|nr:hypothetical protein [Ciceribacter sp. L1K22]MBO3759332.1 hypothetical protein [Ciceribacter sp. L1K22]
MAAQALTDAQKEQIKLRATFLNNIGVGVILIGVFTPIARAFYDAPAAGAPFGHVSIPVVICFSLGVALHMVAGWILRGLNR